MSVRLYWDALMAERRWNYLDTFTVCIKESVHLKHDYDNQGHRCVGEMGCRTGQMQSCTRTLSAFFVPKMKIQHYIVQHKVIHIGIHRRKPYIRDSIDIDH